MRLAHGRYLLKHAVSLRAGLVRPSRPTQIDHTRWYRTRKSPELEHGAVFVDQVAPPTEPASEPLLIDASIQKARRARKPRAGTHVPASTSEGLAEEAAPSAIEPTSEPKPKRARKPRTPKDTSAPPNPKRSPSTQSHHDLDTFLAHAAQISLSRTTNVYLGTHYEYTVSASLSRLRFTTTRTGGANDQGIDLLGHWTLPSAVHPIPAIIQCKATAPLAVMMRELEGSMASAPPGWRGDNVIGLLAATKVATKGIRDAMARSAVPLGFLCVDAKEGAVRQFVWNQAAVVRCGIEGVGVALSYPEEHVVLTWQGEPWHPKAKLKKKSGPEKEVE